MEDGGKEEGKKAETHSEEETFNQEEYQKYLRSFHQYDTSDPRYSTSNADGISFENLCKVFESMARETKKEKKLRIFFSDKLRDTLKGQTVYPILRLLCPQQDIHRSAYRLKSSLIAKIYIKNLALSPEHPDAKVLLNWKDPTQVQSRLSTPSGKQLTGDFAGILAEILRPRSISRGKRTVGETNEMLDKVAIAKDFEAKRKLFMEILQNYTALEQKYIVRMMHDKEIKIGLNYKSVLRHLHPDALEFFSTTTDLRRLCYELRDPKIRMACNVEVGTPFQPMLAKHTDYHQLQFSLTYDFVIEPKFDGERIVCHKDGDRVCFFTRKANDYSERYGPSIAPHIRSEVTVERCILDGEMIAWDSELQKAIPFGSNRTVAKQQSKAQEDGEEEGNQYLWYKVFDVVYISDPRGLEIVRSVIPAVVPQGKGEGLNLMGLPLTARRKILEKILSPFHARVDAVDQVVVDQGTPAERYERVMQELNSKVEEGYEGLICKSLTSSYVTGLRRGEEWIKIKPEFAGILSHLDVLILGAYYGEGTRRSGQLSHFLIGVLANPSLDQNNEEEAPDCYTLAKVGSGYSLTDLQVLNEKLNEHWQPFDHKRPPKHLPDWTPSVIDRPDRWIDPRKTVVLEIKGMELVATNTFSCGFTIRFPRVQQIRWDKNWFEAMTLREVSDLRDKGMKRSHDDEPAQRKRQVTRKVLKSNDKGVISAFRAPDLSSVMKQGEEFKGLEMRVIAGTYKDIINNKKITSDELAALIASHGGKLTMNQTPNTKYVIAAPAATNKLVVKNIIRSDSHNILTSEWVFECIREKQLIEPKRRHYLHLTRSSKEALSSIYDRFGDPWTSPASIDEMPIIIAEVDRLREQGEVPPIRPNWRSYVEEHFLLEEQKMLDQNPYLYMWRSKIYFVDQEYGENELGVHPLAYEKDVMRRRGAAVAENLDRSVTHVVLDTNHDRHNEILRSVFAKIRSFHSVKRAAVVSQKWVKESVEQGQQLLPDDYMLNIHS